MFHRVNDPTSQCDPIRFAKFLDYLIQTYPIIGPNDPLPNTPLAVMLTFDDAYFDFYHSVFPLLKYHKIKAMLAVPANYILENTNISTQTRLSVPYPQGMNNNLHLEKAPFCTWQELREMANSSHVIMASHSASHANLEKSSADFHQEIVGSKIVLEQHLKQPIEYFVYPYGKMCSKAHNLVKQHYRFGVRIGSAINYGWDKHSQYIYRVDADPIWKHERYIDDALIRKLTLKYWINKIRRK